ncbi:hypothetical protein [uncultured Sphingomonas sp.]|uniref:hypothetical protein n=1 Tax=uncultured Sphingomonas sp. TaxID=158754 RepID=UPI0037495494
MKLTGYILLGLGSLIVLAAYGTDTAPEGTHNIGLMQGQMMLFQAGAVLVIVGALCAIASITLGRLEAAGILPPAGSVVSVQHTGSGQ